MDSSQAHSTSSSRSTTSPPPPPPPPPPPAAALPQRKYPPWPVARKIYTKQVLTGIFLIISAIFIVFSIYWGAMCKVPARPLPGLIVDFDNGQIGNTIASELASLSDKRIKWTVAPATDFPGGIEQVTEYLLDEKTWVVVAINQNVSQTLESALTNPNPSYNGSLAISVLATEARSENAYRSITRPALQEQLDAIVTRFAVSLVRTFPAAGVNMTGLVTVSPQTIVQPVGYTLNNIRPFDVPVAAAPTFVGLIYLLILSFYLVNFALTARAASGLEYTLSTRNLVFLKLGTAVTGYFILSLFYSLLSVAFHLPVERHFGRAGFVIFWMLNWIAMTSVGLAMESMTTLMTTRFVQFFMILWIISNVAVAFQPIEVLPTVYRYGHAAPFHLVSMGIRTIVFNTKNKLSEDFGILIVWITISCITLPIFQTIARRRNAAATAAATMSQGGDGAARAGRPASPVDLKSNTSSPAQTRSIDEKRPPSPIGHRPRRVKRDEEDDDDDDVRRPIDHDPERDSIMKISLDGWAD